MPGLNKQGPEGSGPMTGRQQGMCRRTEELQLKGRRDGQGRGMGGRCRGNYFQQPASQQGSQNVTENAESGGVDELTSLRSEYQKAQAMIDTLMGKIKELETKVSSSSSAKSNDET